MRYSIQAADIKHYLSASATLLDRGVKSNGKFAGSEAIQCSQQTVKPEIVLSKVVV